MRNSIGIFGVLLQMASLVGTPVRAAETAVATPQSAFRFHVVDEPSQIRPNFSDRFTGQYLIGSLFHGFYRYNGQNKLVPALAKKCEWRTPKILQCDFGENHWSNGQLFTAKDIYEHLQRSLDPKMAFASAEIFLNVKNFKEFLTGQSPWSDVGIRLSGKTRISFTLNTPDRDFIFRLTHPGLSPVPADVTDLDAGKNYATGPYSLNTWKRGRSLTLTSNPKIAGRPDVEVFFIAEDTTALNLFEKNKLDLLRKMPAETDRRYLKDPRYREMPFVRFDYLGIGPHVAQKTLDEIKLGQAFDFDEFRQVFQMKGTPGCSGLPVNWQTKVHCLKFDKKTKTTSAPTFEFYYAAQAGDEIARTVQWFQGQYKKNRGGFLNLKPEDVKMLTARLRTSPPDLFRRGLPVDRPTCQAALEAFKTDSPDNFIGFKNKEFDRVVTKLSDPGLSETDLKRDCSKAVKMLIDSKRIIPLGEIYYPMLDAGRFKGWAINNLNQLDLTDLQPATSK